MDAPQIVHVEYLAIAEYEVEFYIKKPHAYVKEVVKTTSISSARSVIFSRYGKDKIQIIKVQKVTGR